MKVVNKKNILNLIIFAIFSQFLLFSTNVYGIGECYGSIGCCGSIFYSWDWSSPNDLFLTVPSRYYLLNVTLNDNLYTPTFENRTDDDFFVFKLSDLKEFHKNKLYELRANYYYQAESDADKDYRQVTSFILVCGYYGKYEPDLKIEVSPPFYPEVGQRWKIETYISIMHCSEDFELIYEEKIILDTANVIMSTYIESEDRRILYTKNTDKNGISFFERKLGYDLVSFYANIRIGERILQSEEFLLQSEYISPSLPLSIFPIPLTVLLAIIRLKSNSVKRYRRLLDSLLLGQILSGFIFTFIFAFYIMYFRTYWGYPLKIWSNFTYYNLLNIFFIWLALTIVYIPIFLRSKSKASGTRLN